MDTFRQRVDTGFERLARLIYRNRFRTLLLMFVLIGGLVSQLPKIGFDTSNESYFHEGDPTLVNYDAFREQFGRDQMVIVAITPPKVFDKAFLERLKAFHSALEERVPYLDEVTSLVNVRNTRGEGDELIVEDLLETFPETPDELARLETRVLSSPLYRNLLISEDGRVTTVWIETLAHSPGDVQKDLISGFDEAADQTIGRAAEARVPLTVEENREMVMAVEEVIAAFEAPEFPLHLAGGPVFDDFFERTMQQDTAMFLGFAFLAIGIFLLLLFRRLSGVLLPLMVVVLSLLSTIGLMAVSGILFTMPTTILPSFLLAVGVGASVHLLAVFFRRYEESGDKEGAIVYGLGHSGLPIFMTGLTTSAGLFAFGTSEMAPVAHLGIFAGIGVLISLVYTLVLLPALLAIVPIRQHTRFTGARQGEGFDRLLAGIAHFATSRAWSVVIVSAVIVAVSVFGLFSLRFSQNFLAWLPRSLELRQSTELIDRELKGSVPLEIVIDTGRENGLYEPAVMNKIDALGQFAKSYRNSGSAPFVGKTNSVVNVLKETHQALNENRSEFYAIPQNRELIAQELLLFENSGSDDLERLVDSQFSKARLTLIAPNYDAAMYVNFVEEINRKSHALFGETAQVTVTGSMNLFTQMIHNMMLSMAKSYLIAGVVITVMMILLVGSFRLGLLSMVANFFPILVTLGLVMGFTGIRLDAATLLLGSIALGLAVDDTIHFFHNFRRYYGECADTHIAVRETLLTSGRAMLFTTLVLVTGFWLYMFATLNNNFYFGLLTGLTLIFALAADFLVAPAMLALINRTEAGCRICEEWCGVKATA